MLEQLVTLLTHHTFPDFQNDLRMKIRVVAIGADN